MTDLELDLALAELLLGWKRHRWEFSPCSEGGLFLCGEFGCQEAYASPPWTRGKIQEERPALCPMSRGPGDRRVLPRLSTTQGRLLCDLMLGRGYTLAANLSRTWSAWWSRQNAAPLEGTEIEAQTLEEACARAALARLLADRPAKEPSCG